MKYFCDVQPEFDTVRVIFPSWANSNEYLDVVSFFAYEFKSEVASYQRMSNADGSDALDADGQPIYNLVWEKKRLDMKCSYWCKMQIVQGDYKGTACIVVEFSVAKWYNKTNGINCGYPLDYMRIVSPAILMLKDLNLLKYSVFDSWGSLCRFLLDNVILRRLDLSYNFKVSNVNTAMRMLATCRLNNHDSANFQGKVNIEELADKKGNINIHDLGEFAQTIGNSETVSFGGGRGCRYKAMFYDKFKEQKRLYSMRDMSNTQEEFENRKRFFKANLEKYKNVVRFEVQYNSKMFNAYDEEYQNKRGVEMLDNLITLCETHWIKTLRQFDKQLGASNVQSEETYSLANQAISKLESLRDCGGISFTVCANLSAFIYECSKQNWHNVWAALGRNKFCQRYNKVKNLTGYDVKRECVRELPIMRIMPTQIWKYQVEQQIYFGRGCIVDYSEHKQELVAVC